MLVLGYNFIGSQTTILDSKEKLKIGKSKIRLEFDYDGGGLAKGGMGTLYVNNKKVAKCRIEHTHPMSFSADETDDIGIDLATPVIEAIGAERKSCFTGHIPKVTVEIGAMGKSVSVK